MERLEKYLKAYEDLLLEKGYGEKALKNGRPEGTLIADLRERLYGWRDGQKHGADVCSLQIETSGIAPDGTSVVFRFGFEYDPARGTLDLKAMAADTGQLRILIAQRQQEHMNSEFPAASALFKQIAEYKALREVKVTEQRKKRPGKGI